MCLQVVPRYDPSQQTPQNRPYPAHIQPLRLEIACVSRFMSLRLCVPYIGTFLSVVTRSAPQVERGRTARRGRSLVSSLSLVCACARAGVAWEAAQRAEGERVSTLSANTAHHAGNVRGGRPERPQGDAGELLAAYGRLRMEATLAARARCRTNSRLGAFRRGAFEL